MHSTKHFLILTSPPASGKTHWIETYSAALRDETILVISPLRALADECQVKWQGKITVMTPEEWLMKKATAEIVILDEFHLYFYWGSSFRPQMWEAFYELCERAHLVVALTATMNTEIQESLALFHCHFDFLLWIDQGNLRLKNYPVKYVKAPSKSWLKQVLVMNHQAEAVDLIFCAFRQEVHAIATRLEELGYTVCSCVGGEAQEMRFKLERNSRPDFIVATTVLSHGVNLPEISNIYFLYEVRNVDFWIQMVARGGRKGEEFSVFALEKPLGMGWNSWVNIWQVLKLSLRMRCHLFLRQLAQCFLKDSSSAAFPTKKEISL